MRFAPIGEVAVLNPKQPARLFDDGAAVPFIPMAAVSANGGMPTEERRHFTDLKGGYTYFERGDVLLAKITPCFENGKAALLDSLSRPFGFGSTEFHVLRAGADLDPRYLFHAVRSPQFRRSGASRMTGSAGQQRVPSGFVATYRIPVPSLKEQRRIATLLDKAESIRVKRRTSMHLSSEFLRSAFLKVFGDLVRNERDWPLVRLGDRLQFLTSGSRGWARYYASTGRLFLRIQNVGYNELKLDDLIHVDAPSGAEADRTEVRAGDVLVSITADLGRTAVVPPNFPPAHINQHLALLRVKDLEPLYVAEFIASPGGRRQLKALNRQGVKAGLNFDDIRSVRIPVPPVDRQQRFALLYRRQEATVATVREAIDQSDTLFESLSHHAFRGEL